jgi:hypothetical protein
MILLCSADVFCQNLFYEDCFQGGVTVSGAVRDGGAFELYKCPIKWNENYELRNAFVVCYRYGNPPDHVTFINNTPITWSDDTQVGGSFFEENPLSNPYSTHVQDVSSSLEIQDDTLRLEFPPQSIGPNFGYWSMYVVILYESPNLNETSCVRLYTADTRQDVPQVYSVPTPDFIDGTPVGLSIFSSRITEVMTDQSSIEINDQLIGSVWEDDLIVPPSQNGVQGHFYYEEQEFFGLNGDTANTTMNRHDGIAVINEYLQAEENEVVFYRTNNQMPETGNLFPAFTLAYSSDCEVWEGDVANEYTFCQGDSVQLDAGNAFDNYHWQPAEGLSDSTVSDPWCAADSSGWYRVTMSDEDGEKCAKTVPVFVEVRPVPQPGEIMVQSSDCPGPTGQIVFERNNGILPLTYSVGEVVQADSVFSGLEAGEYSITVEDEFGCAWDSTAVIDLNIIQDANFLASPDSGYTPLSVQFINESENSSDFQWLINGMEVSNNEDLGYVFEEPGVYLVELISSQDSELCSDTASYTIFVEQGMEIAVPNVITPNGDGLNDELVAQLLGVKTLRWKVLNRWGKKVHKGRGSEPEESIVLWSPSRDIEDGQYFLVVVGFGDDGQRQEVKATVTVVR